MPDEIPKEAIKAIDKLYWSPADRASSVYSLLDDIRKHLRKENLKLGRDEEDDIPSEMDLLFFAVEFTGMQAIAMGDEEFLLMAQHQCRFLHSVHYSNPAMLWGEPDRKVEEDGDTQSSGNGDLQEDRETVQGTDGSGASDGGVGCTWGVSEVQGDSEGDTNGDVSDDDTV